MKKLYSYFLFLFAFSIYAQENSFPLKIYFETNQFELTPKNKKILDNLVVFNQKDSTYFIQIEGFTDEKGILEKNIILAENRAKIVAEYLIAKNCNSKQIKFRGKGIDVENENDELQRNVTLQIKQIHDIILPVYESDTLDFNSNYLSNLKEYYSTKQMIKHKMFAIDTSENIIKTAGMISFNVKNKYIKQNNSNEKRYLKACIPLRKGESYDKDMKVWINKPNKKGETRWLKKEYKITFDSISQCYSLLIDCRDLGDFNKINIDKTIPSNEEVIYFSSFKDFDFYDVEIPKSTFSAIVENDKTNFYAFVNEKRNNADNLVFKGKFRENGIEKLLTVNLDKCKLYKYKASKHYYLSKKTNYFINEKEYNKKGFWPWIKRFFVKD